MNKEKQGGGDKENNKQELRADLSPLDFILSSTKIKLEF